MEAALFPRPGLTREPVVPIGATGGAVTAGSQPDFAAIHEQLRRHRQRWRSKLDVVLAAGAQAGREDVRRLGRRDDSGLAPLFVATLGASSYTWAEATRDQQMES